LDNLFITHGLIIDQPWMDLILSGKKVWEMRSQHTKRRGPIALIQKGTKKIVGTAYLHNSKGPLEASHLELFADRHCIPVEMYLSPEYKWDHAWIMNDARRLEQPIPYEHKSGAVIWVELDADACNALKDSMAEQKSTVRKKTEKTLTSGLKGIQEAKSVTQTISGSAEYHGKVPYAKDGTFFCEDFCAKRTGYTVGEKGNEQLFDKYQDALEYLKKMPTAKWRRPNPNGNWGIVSAVDWAEAPR
jgi:hypothetical protein